MQARPQKKNCTTQKEIWNNPKSETLESLAKNSNNEHKSALSYCGFQLTPELEGTGRGHNTHKN